MTSWIISTSYLAGLLQSGYLHFLGGSVLLQVAFMLIWSSRYFLRWALHSDLDIFSPPSWMWIITYHACLKISAAANLALLGKFLLGRKFMLVSFLSFSTTYGIFLISSITDSTMDANQQFRSHPCELKRSGQPGIHQN